MKLEDADKYSTSYDDIRIGELWYANFPYMEDDQKDENGDSTYCDDRPVLVIEKRGENDHRRFRVIKITHGTKRVKKKYTHIIHIPGDDYRLACNIVGDINERHFRARIVPVRIPKDEFDEIVKLYERAMSSKYKVEVTMENALRIYGNEDDYLTEAQVLYSLSQVPEVIQEAKLKASERTNFGLPSKKKYPMTDPQHVRQAIRMFNHCDPEDEAELARNIKKYMKKYGIEDVEVSEKNRFSKYYHGSKNEETILESAKKKYHTYEDAKYIFDSLTDQEKKWCCPNGYKNTPAMVFRKIAYDNNDNPLGFVELADAYKYKPEDFYKRKLGLTIAVCKKGRGQGIAKALIKLAVHWFKESKYEVLFYNVDSDNKASIKLAEKCGFIWYCDLDNKHAIRYVITNGTKMKEAIGESTEVIEEIEEEDNSVYFEEDPDTPEAIAEEMDQMIQELSGGGGPVIGMEINDQSVTTYNPGMFIISYGSKRVGKYDDDDGRSSGYAVANDFYSKYIYVKKNGKAVREEGLSFLRDRKISIYEFVGDRDKWFNLLKAIDEGTCDGEFYTALTGRTLYTDDQIYFDEHFKYYNPIKRRLDNDMTFNINEEFSLVEGKEWLLPVMDDEMMSLQEKVNNINPYLTIKEGPKGYYLFDEAHSMCSAHPVSKRDIEMYLKK